MPFYGVLKRIHCLHYLYGYHYFDGKQHKLTFAKGHLARAKWRPSWFGLNVLTHRCDQPDSSCLRYIWGYLNIAVRLTKHNKMTSISQQHPECQWGALTLNVVAFQSFRFNTLRPRQNGRHFASDMFQFILLDENYFKLISLKFFPMGSIKNKLALVGIGVWHRTGDRLLSKPMVA